MQFILQFRRQEGVPPIEILSSCDDPETLDTFDTIEEFCTWIKERWTFGAPSQDAWAIVNGQTDATHSVWPDRKAAFNVLEQLNRKSNIYTVVPVTIEREQ